MVMMVPGLGLKKTNIALSSEQIWLSMAYFTYLMNQLSQYRDKRIYTAGDFTCCMMLQLSHKQKLKTAYKDTNTERTC